jgi:tryptophan synthase beta chain
MILATAHDPGPRGRFGQFGGQYVAETLMPALAELEAAWRIARVDAGFGAEVGALLTDYVGRPSRCTGPSASAPRSAPPSCSSART